MDARHHTESASEHVEAMDLDVAREKEAPMDRVAGQDPQSTMEVEAHGPSPHKRNRLALEDDCVLACRSDNTADAGHHEEEDWSLRTRGRHDLFELDDINHDSLASFKNDPQEPGDLGLAKPDAVSRLDEPCGTSLSPEADDRGRLGLDEPHVSEKRNTIVLDETTPEASKDEEIASATFEKVGAEASKKRKSSTVPGSASNGHGQVDTVVKKAKKRPVNVWAKTSSRKGGKKNSKNGSQQNPKSVPQENSAKENCVYLTPANKNQDKIEDGPDLPVVLSKFHKAERIDLSDDRLSAGSTKGYRMVRATRGVTDGAWYFEILVEKLGQTGHTRLGWSTQKGEIQAPVGFDNNSYAYRDVDGSKVHMAIREPYGQPYVEGDVIGFYINLPHGAELAPKPAPLVSYRGQPYIVEEKEDPRKVVPGSEIAFFRNGVIQGTAFKDISAGRYFPAASMYTLPNEPNCTVKFHFGPDFRFPPRDIGERPVPQAICCAPHCGMDSVGFGSMAWKCESHEVNAELQKAGEARSFP